MTITKHKWAEHQNKDVFLYSLDNGNMQVTITNFGCIINAILLNVNGTKRNIVLSYESFAEYVADQFYLGCVVGRFANRISGGTFEIDGRQHQLSINEPTLNNHVHGGFEGFGKKLFEPISESIGDNESSVTFRYVSVHNEEGYPGTVELVVTFTLNIANEITIAYRAVADQPTHVNLTHHTYFNLDGSKLDATNHSLYINANQFLESNERFLPTGNILQVQDTTFDFREMRKVFLQKGTEPEPVYNTFFMFAENAGHMQAVLANGTGELSVGVGTSLPGVLLYTGDYLDMPFVKYGGICLECQYPPDAPNHAAFPSTLLMPGDVFDHYTRYTIRGGLNERVVDHQTAQ